MDRYTKGRLYNVQLNTQHKHHLTWAKFVKEIEQAGPAGVAEEDLLNICRADKNSGFVSYCVRNEWLRKVVTSMSR